MVRPVSLFTPWGEYVGRVDTLNVYRKAKDGPNRYFTRFPITMATLFRSSSKIHSLGVKVCVAKTIKSQSDLYKRKKKL